MEKKLVYIEINDWDDEFETEKCKRFVELEPNSIDKIAEDADFNFYFTSVDMAIFYMIVGTEEEIKNCGYGELLESGRIIDWDEKPRVGLCVKEDFPEYDPSKWHTKENGQYKNIFI